METSTGKRSFASRVTALFLAALIAFAYLPYPAFAESAPGESGSGTEKEFTVQIKEEGNESNIFTETDYPEMKVIFWETRNGFEEKTENKIEATRVTDEEASDGATGTNSDTGGGDNGDTGNSVSGGKWKVTLDTTKNYVYSVVLKPDSDLKETLGYLPVVDKPLLIPDGDSTEITIPMAKEEKKPVTGKVVTEGEEATGIAGAKVELTGENEYEQYYTYSTTTNTDGSFSIDNVVVNDGVTYTLTVTKEGYDTVTGSSVNVSASQEIEQISMKAEDSTIDKLELKSETQQAETETWINHDISVTITAQDNDSGLKQIEYWVTKEDDAGASAPQTESVEETNKNNEFPKTVVIASSDYPDYTGMLTFHAKATDLKGNDSEQTICFLLDTKAPVVSVNFDDSENEKKDEEGGYAYFAKERKATVSITEKNFELDEANQAILDAITVTVTKNGKEECVSVEKYVSVGDWTDSENGVHTAEVTFKADARYELDTDVPISYTDKAGNTNSGVDYGSSQDYQKFVIDSQPPTGELTVTRKEDEANEDGSIGQKFGEWVDRTAKLLFGFSKAEVTVSGTCTDGGNPVKSFSYYLNSEDQGLSEIQLASILDGTDGADCWTEFTKKGDGGYEDITIAVNSQTTVYARIIDYAGHTSYLNTEGMITDNKKPEVTITLPSADETIYSGDVTADVKVDDSNDKGAASGIREVRYEVYNNGVKTFPSVEEEAAGKDCLYKVEFLPESSEEKLEKKNIQMVQELKAVISSEKNNSNNVKIKVIAIDNAGNESSEEKSLSIDTTPPKIEISYDNNNVENEKYFKEKRTATIKVTERNFDPAKITADIENAYGNVPTLAADSWTQEGTPNPDGNGDDTVHKATLVFEEDGAYTMSSVSCTDQAGNVSSGVDYGDSKAPEDFVVDKTQPEITVGYNTKKPAQTTGADGKTYISEAFSVLVTVKEQNFDPARITFDLTKEYGEIPSFSASNWQKVSDEVHTLSLSFAVDGSYHLNGIECTDPAGQKSSGMECSVEQNFILDLTAPVMEVVYDNNEMTGEKDGRGYFDQLRKAEITITERNFNAQKATEALQNGIKAYDKDGKPLSAQELSEMIAVSEWTVPEGSGEEEFKHTATLAFQADGNYEASYAYTDEAGHMSGTPSYGDSRAPEKFTADRKSPSGSLTVKRKEDDGTGSVFGELINSRIALIFGFSKEEVTVNGICADEISPVKAFYYYLDAGTVRKSEQELKALDPGEWIAFTTDEAGQYRPFAIPKNHQAVVYAKIVDYAGNISYLSTNGMITDNVLPEITITLPQADDYIYNGDVSADIKVDDPKNGKDVASGLKSVRYEVKSSGTRTFPKEDSAVGSGADVLYALEKEEPEYADLQFSMEKAVTVLSSENNSNEVVIAVTAEDCAGNSKTVEKKLKIDITKPEIQVSYRENDPYKISGGCGYFPIAKRTADITITERNFNGEKAAQALLAAISRLDAEGNPLSGNGYVTIGSWTDEAGSTEDGATHKITVEFRGNAGYQVSDIVYTDEARNSNPDVDYMDSVAAGRFTLDTDKPSGTLTVTRQEDGEIGEVFRSWIDSQMELRFGFSQKEVSVTGSCKDDTSPIESFSYYIDDGTVRKSVEELAEVEWSPFPAEAENSFLLGINRQSTVYAKIVDNAGNTAYLATDGVITDDKEPEIAITAPKEDGFIYDGDVSLELNILDEKGEESAAAGIRMIRYEVYNQGVKTQEEELYRCPEDPVYEDLKFRMDDTVVISSEKNNSNEVTLKVTAEDNSGNQTEQSRTLRIDTTAPAFQIRYQNNDVTAAVGTDTYFQTGRTAVVEVQERNFDPEKVMADLTNDYGECPVFSEWKMTEAPQGNGDNTRYQATLDFSEDGHYVIHGISCTDLAGWKTEVKEEDYGDSKAPEDFIVDTIDPEIQVDFDNNDANYVTEQNRGYFRNPRTAEIRITERNFNEEKARAAVLDTITAVDSAGNPVDTGDISELVDMSDWVTDPADVTKHAAVLTFDQEANYVIDYVYTDESGRGSGKADCSGDVAPNQFTVDYSAPTGSVSAEQTAIFPHGGSLADGLLVGLFSNTDIFVSGSAADAISPVASVKYYKTSGMEVLSGEEIFAIADSEWENVDLEGGDLSKLELFRTAPNDKFQIYVRLEDYAGNVSYIGTDGVIADNAAPVITITTPLAAENVYRDNVTATVTVQDPSRSDVFSGIKSIDYAVYNMGTQTAGGNLYTFRQDIPDVDDLVQNMENTIVIDRSNNSNQVEVQVSVTDNAGNTNTSTHRIQMDTTAPSISVSYDNNDGDASFNDSVYFKDSRTATIRIRERNFNPDHVQVTITNTDGVIPSISGWTSIPGSGNGDDMLHTATITYAADGDYTFAVSCTDSAGNASGGTDYGNSLSPEAFTVDQTVPTIEVAYDNNDSLNENYYKESRTATVTVHEHNFEAGRVTLTMNAEDNGNAASAPAFSAWSSAGDVHQATLSFDADALYTWSMAYTDKAGNPAVDLENQTFYVDQTAPSVVVRGINNHSAHNESGNIGLTIDCTDAQGNLDVFEPNLTYIVKEGNSYVPKEVEWNVSDITNGRRYSVVNLANDGMYSLTCTASDLAGNTFDTADFLDESGNAVQEARTEADEIIAFSVNRDGSVFWIEDNGYTQSVVNHYYVQSVEEDLQIFEVDVDPLNSYEVTLNGEALAEGSDYSVETSGGNGAWYQYSYTISKALFENEGENNIVVESADQTKTGQDEYRTAYSDLKDAALSFNVDKTPPSVILSGIENNGRYQVEEQSVTAIPTDDGGKLQSVRVTVTDSKGEPLKDESGEDISVRVDLSGEELDDYLSKNDGQVRFTIPEGMNLGVRVVSSDASVDADGNTNQYTSEYTGITVSASSLVIFYANKPLFYGTVGGGCGVAAAAGGGIVWRRRRKFKLKAK